jgi:tRNA G46 methylase TrmB
MGMFRMPILCFVWQICGHLCNLPAPKQVRRKAADRHNGTKNRVDRVFEAHRQLKQSVREFWNRTRAAKFTRLGTTNSNDSRHTPRRDTSGTVHSRLACFSEAAGRDVLEIGVGMGADHVEWAKHRPRSLAESI